MNDCGLLDKNFPIDELVINMRRAFEMDDILSI